MKMFSESIFKIKTAKGEYPVLGQSYGDGLLGVHRHLEKFHVTHIPTGLRIASFPSLQQAKAFIVDVGDMDLAESRRERDGERSFRTSRDQSF